jgi:predicted dehydrogenase
VASSARRIFPRIGLGNYRWRVYDIKPEAALETARRFAIPKVFATLDDRRESPTRCSTSRCRAIRFLGVLQRLPEGAPVLIQKPMGENLHMARQILATSRERTSWPP